MMTQMLIRTIVFVNSGKILTIFKGLVPPVHPDKVFGRSYIYIKV